jgi:hypothetical protein
MEWVAIVALAILLTLVHREGIKAGEKKVWKETDDQILDAGKEVADAHLDAKRAAGIVARVRGAVERALARRGSSD